MIYFRFEMYAVGILIRLGCFFRFRNDPRRWFFLSLAVAMALMAISAASSRIAHRNELAAGSSKLRQSVADWNEQLARADPQKIGDDPKLRAVQAAIPRLETELDDLAIAPAILPSVPWNSVEGYTALGALVTQIIGVIHIAQWYRSARTLKVDLPQTDEIQQPAV